MPGCSMGRGVRHVDLVLLQGVDRQSCRSSTGGAEGEQVEVVFLDPTSIVQGPTAGGRNGVARSGASGATTTQLRSLRRRGPGGRVRSALVRLSPGGRAER